ncbi:hypothetical protein BGZ58_001708, partial [Dissophora ornata]
TLHNIMGTTSADDNLIEHKKSSDDRCAVRIATGDLENNSSSRTTDHFQNESDGFFKRLDDNDNDNEDGNDCDSQYTIGALSFGKPFDAMLAELSPTTTKAPEFAVSACTAAASLLSVSTGTSTTQSVMPSRPSLIRIESQELLPTRRPDRRLSPSGSSTSLRSQSSRTSISSRDKSSKSQRGSTEKSATTRMVEAQLTKVLKSILKKTRPVWTTRHQVHSHLGPMLQYQHLELQEQRLQELCLHRQASLQQQQQTVDGQQQQQQLRILQQWSHGSSRLSQKHPHLRVSIPSVGKPPSLDRIRPLPTPPLIKHVRWAAYNEALEIENIDELILLGYYDDYDSDLGWNYRDESKDASSLEEETEDDTEDDTDEAEEDQYGPMCSGHQKNAAGSDAGRVRQPVNYYDQVYHQSHQHQHQHYQQNQPLRHPWTPSDYSCDAESVASTLGDESEIAEDDLIQRMDSLFSSASSMPSFFPSQLLNKHHQGLVQRFQFFNPTSALNGNGNVKNFPERPPSPPPPALPPRSQSPAFLRPQSPPVLAKAGERPLPPIPTTDPEPPALPSRLKSPPPPYLSTMSLHLPPSLLHQRRNPQDLSGIANMLSCQADKDSTEPKAEETIYNNTQSRSMNKAPRLDRDKIRAEVAERKRNGTGIFAWRAGFRRMAAAATAKSGPNPGPDKRHGSSDSGPASSGSGTGPKSNPDLSRVDTVSSISSSNSSSRPSTPSLSYSSTSSSPSPSPSHCTSVRPFSIESAGLGMKPKVNMETGRSCASQYPIYAENVFPRTAIQVSHARSTSPLVAF